MTPQSSTSTLWYAQTWFTILMLIVFPPLGWFLMWKYRMWKTATKAWVTGISAIVFIPGAISNFLPTPPQSASVSGVAPPAQPANSSAPNDQQPDTPATSNEQQNAQTSSVFQIGDIGVLRTASGSPGDTLYIATTNDAFNKMSDAAQAKDNVGFDQLLANGSAFSITEGTHAKWLGDEPLLQVGLKHIRITEGPHATEDGWVPREWLKKE